MLLSLWHFTVATLALPLILGGTTDLTLWVDAGISRRGALAYLAAQYRRIAARRGKKRATMAVAHSILVIAYHVIQLPELYRELGADYFDRQRPEATTKRLVKRLENLGY